MSRILQRFTAYIGEMYVDHQRRSICTFINSCLKTKLIAEPRGAPCKVLGAARCGTDLLDTKCCSIGNAVGYCTSTRDKSILDKIYSDAEKQKIIDFLNTASSAEMRANKITQSQQRGILELRPISSLSDLMKIPKMNIVTLQRMCRATLKVRDVEIVSKKRNLNALTPMPTEDEAANINIVTAIDITMDTTYYVKMASDMTVLDAGCLPMGKSGKPVNFFRYDYTGFLKEMINLTQDLPKSDAFLLTRRQLKSTKKQIHGLYYGKLLAEAILSTLLVTQEKPITAYVLMENYISQRFSLRVGGENVHSSNLIDDIISEGKWDGREIKNMQLYDLKTRDCNAMEKQHLNALFRSSVCVIADFLIPLSKTEQPAEN